jgi:catechol 2,3-dioxygenase-like lactoylglutathione lyase family enzyme
MYSHTMIGANDLSRARTFYEAVFAPLALELKFSDETYLAWAAPGKAPQFFVGKPFNGEAPHPGNGPMIALLAPKRSAVDACHAAAMEQGGTDEGQPGLRPHYHKDYYGAYFRDLDGNKICIVCHQPE